MADLFVSYSRKNIETARKLIAAFKEQKLEFWIDWQRIPPTVEWWQEIQRGIEEADVFLFLLSPDSAKSEVCNQEILHAAQNGKRLIPVVISDLALADVPDKLKPLNWIFLRECDDFKTNIELLIKAIQTDYEWVQTHRQLQLKALEWDKSKREKSLLLRGNELHTTELNLVSNSQKEPFLTPLQYEYVRTSQKEKVRQTRYFANAGLAVLLTISALAYTPTKAWLTTPELPGWRSVEFVRDESPQILAMNFRDPDEVYASSLGSGTLYGSTNGARTWHTLSVVESESAVIGLAAIEGHVFALTDQEIWLSNDRGESWSLVTGPTDNAAAYRSISVNPLKANEVYVGTDHGMLYQSQDRGSTWQIVAAGYEGKSVQAVAVNGTTIIVATEEGIWSKDMRRTTWNALSLEGCTDHEVDITALAFTHPYDAPPLDGAYGYAAAIRELGVCDSDTLNRNRTSLMELPASADGNVTSIVIADVPNWTTEGYMIAGNTIHRKRIWYFTDIEWWELKVESRVSEGE